MRIKLAVATLALAMLSSTVANATIAGNVSLDQTAFPLNIGQTINLTGNFYNTSPTDTILVDALSLQTNPIQVDKDDFTSTYSGTILAPGQNLLSVAGGNNPNPPNDILFGNITIGSAFTGIVSVFYDDLTTGQMGIPSNEVNINTVATTVPEPGSLALLSGCLLSGGLFIKRRRK